jgi:alkylation response protein AidB-like acyl-CoA dehydrogenase
MAIDLSLAGSSAAAAAAIEAAHDIAPRARALAAQTEREGRVPPELVAEIKDAGLFHLLLPREYGGAEVDPMTASRVVDIISAADGSTGWVVMLAAQSCSFAGMMPPDDARTIWGTGGIVAGTANPVGRAVWTDTPEPGYIITGRWGFASGSSHATWFTGECVVYDGDQPRKDADGNDVTRVVFVLRDDKVKVYETWNVTGLRGTASNDFSIEGAFTPASRGFQMLVTPPVHPWPLYRALPLLFINHGAQALGVARGAIESATEVARKKRGWGGVPMTELPRIQMALAQATALVESASDYMYGTATRLWEAVLAGEETPDLRARTRLATSNAATMAVQAVDTLHNALGTAAIMADNPIERQFRDIHTAAKHVMIGHMTYEAAGRVLLGMEPQFPFF